MNSRLPLLLLLILTHYSSFAQKVNKDFIDGEIYLKVNKKPLGSLSSQVNLNTELTFLQKYSAELVLSKSSKTFYTNSSENLQKIYRITVKNPAKIDALISLIKQESEVDYVEKVPYREIIATPNDPDQGSQWFLPKIKAFEAWSVNPGSATIVVAVVDNAIQTNHVDLQANMLAGRDMGDNDNDPNPPNEEFSHGTHVAGIVSAVTNNGIGIAAASNNRVKVLPVKATPDSGNPRGIYYGFEGITWAADNGAKIISLSWGGNGYAQAEQEVVNYAYEKGILIVAAAGNENNSIQNFPGAYANVISVASLDSDDKRSSFSSYGSWVDISAPGRGILSTIPFNSYASFNGTSMATPLVSSALGYLWSCFPTLTPAQLENILKTTADNIDAQNPTQTGLLGVGRINLLKAVSCPSSGIFNATITASGSTYICQGTSVTLNANTGSGLNYQWLKNGQETGNVSNSIIATTDGNYQVIVSNGNCSILSNPTKITYNTILTSAPSVSDKEISYCTTLTAGNGIQAVASNCNFGGPSTFTYNGPTVGYDGFDKNNSDPSINVVGLGGLTTSIKVSVTWEKKDQGNENACDLQDGGGIPFNEEVSFKLQSPTGTIVTLIANATFARGTTTSGIVTTVFEEGSTPLALGSIPTSGTFAPNQSFSSLLNDVPIGIWTLLPEDDSFVDPLCVKSFSITINTNSSPQAPVTTWWSAQTSGALLHTGIEYLPTTSMLGERTFYVQSVCDGLCPSPRVPVTLTITPIPQVYVFPISMELQNDISFKNLLNNGHIQLTKNTNNQYEVFDANSPSSSSIVIGNTPPLTSPITLCSTNTYLLLAIGCPTNNITWTYGENGQALIVTPTSPIGYNATCHQSWSPCSPISSNNILFLSPLEHVPIENKVYANSVQSFNGRSITASNEIQTPAKIDYKASANILLNPGFSVSGNSIFTAKIGGCNN